MNLRYEWSDAMSKIKTVYTRAKFTSLRKKISMRNEREDGVCLLFFVWSIGVPV